MQIRRPSALAGGLVVLTTCLGGCVDQPTIRIAPAPIPMRQAEGIVNANARLIRSTIRAVGAVDGHFTREDGRRRTYHLDGVLFLLKPDHVRFDLKALGTRQFLFGCNANDYWIYNREEKAYQCGAHNAQSRSDVPFTPAELIEALGLSPITDTQGHRVQRITDQFQQILLRANEDGEPRSMQKMRKEYWLDRFPPRLIRRIVFRDADGVVTMESILGDYKRPRGMDAFLPHLMTVRWLTTGAEMKFRISRWKPVESVGPDSIQFAMPSECRRD